MSKLYATIDSDSRKGPATSSGHKWVRVSAMHNFTGGQSADGTLMISVDHRGDKVLYDVDYKEGYSGAVTPMLSITVYPDGTVTKR